MLAKITRIERYSFQHRHYELSMNLWTVISRSLGDDSFTRISGWTARGTAKSTSSVASIIYTTWKCWAIYRSGCRNWLAIGMANGSMDAKDRWIQRNLHIMTSQWILAYIMITGRTAAPTLVRIYDYFFFHKSFLLLWMHADLLGISSSNNGQCFCSCILSTCKQTGSFDRLFFY